MGARDRVSWDSGTVKLWICGSVGLDVDIWWHMVALHAKSQESGRGRIFVDDLLFSGGESLRYHVLFSYN